MKVYVGITTEDVAPNDLLDNLWLTVENQRYSVREFLPILEDLKVCFHVFDDVADTFTYKVWIKTPFDIQKIELLEGVAYINQSFDQLESTNGNVLRNFVRINVVQFQKGKVYLIPFSAGAVTNVVPSMCFTTFSPEAGSDDKVADLIVAQTYVYKSANEEQTRNAQSFNCISYDVDANAAKQVFNEVSAKRVQSARNFQKSIELS